MARLRPLLLALLGAALATSAPAAAAPTPSPYGTNDAGGFRNILPPGNNGLANALGLIQFEANKTHPAHNDDQLNLYGDLVYKAPQLTAADLNHFYKDATFGVKPADVASTYSPRSDVTIVRDKGFGTPHIYGSTRAGTMFGAGYAAAQDRLFFIDVLRHLGRGQLSSFAGGSEGNRQTEADQWAIAPYTEHDLQLQLDDLPQLYGSEGQTILDDANAYVAGINKYIQEARADPINKMPGEYAAIGKPQGPDDWNARDIIATASLVGGIFGKGGGGEVQSALALQAAQKQLGKRKGRKAWHDFRSINDPEAPTTEVGKRFPYEIPPKKAAKGSLAMPDPGSVKFQPVRGGSSASAKGTAAGPRGSERCLAKAIVCLPKSASNALVVSAKESQSGHPLAVFGPQTGYFSPQILMEQDMHGPGIDARGAAFPGVNLYVELGRGPDYAWSATSAGQDIVDTFALPLCTTDGSPPTTQSDHYMYRGSCRKIESLDRTNSWTPSAADQTPPGSETLHAERTALGIVIARATIKHKPVVYTSQRSTYMHEVDSARGFADFNNPAKMTSPQDFQRAAYKIGYTFNWLYVDDKHDAYFNSGNNPVRGKKTDPNFPVWGTKKRFEWRNFNPDNLTAKYTPFNQHPQTIDQRFLTSWNNKQAPGYASSDNKWSYSPTFRSQLLSERIQRGIKGPLKMTLPQLAGAMEDAGTADLRGDQNLPWALKILGKQKDPALAAAIAKLKSWYANGSHRRDKNHDGTYDESDAVRIMDAWWPLWFKAEFEPVMGKDAYERITSINEPDNAPNNHGAHLGSAYDDGGYGYINKDLRTIVNRKKVKGRYSRVYCGGSPKRNGTRKRCRKLLAGTLAQAIKMTPAQLYHGDPMCTDGDQWCWDAVYQRPLGAITQPLIHWINRPTFQQAVEIPKRAR